MWYVHKNVLIWTYSLVMNHCISTAWNDTKSLTTLKSSIYMLIWSQLFTSITIISRKPQNFNICSTMMLKLLQHLIICYWFIKFVFNHSYTKFGNSQVNTAKISILFLIFFYHEFLRADEQPFSVKWCNVKTFDSDVLPVHNWYKIDSIALTVKHIN